MRVAVRVAVGVLVLVLTVGAMLADAAPELRVLVHYPHVRARLAIVPTVSEARPGRAAYTPGRPVRPLVGRRYAA